MNRKLFELALDKIRPSDWEHFEEISSTFLASDFPSLRTMANPSGDGGRDSELFSPEGNNKVAIQYSVSDDWNAKIKKTFNRISETLTNVRVLIYMTNQVVGAKGDKIKTTGLTDYGVSLDIRDRSWFLERFELDDAKYGATSTLVDIIARPFLEGEKVIEHKRPALTSLESKAALTYLGLQWEDESTDKGLTKIVYESLVRAALRNTNSENRLSRQQVYDRIFTYIPSNICNETKVYIDSALNRLSKGVVKHWQKDDEFCLSHDESLRILEKLSETECEELEFVNEIIRLVKNEKEDNNNVTDDAIPEISERIARIIDTFLIKSGESFASSVITGVVNINNTSVLKDIIFEDINSNPSNENYVASLPDMVLNVTARVLTSKNHFIKTHLKKISDTYTLFSFLRETPDIQKATKKIFTHAKIWLDTTIVLPLLAESLKPDEEDKKYTRIVNSLTDINVELRVTDGVIQEVLNHIRISENCARHTSAEWKGRIPFLYYHYIEFGYSPINFSNAAEVFRGHSRPEEDIAEYLNIKHGLKVESLKTPATNVDNDVRFAIERLWREAHENRRSSSNGDTEFDVSVTDMLIRHDVESYLGIIGLRADEQVTELGYKHWWLTIDSLAWKIRNKIKEEFEKPPMSPLMSLDFLSNSLSFGPARSRLDRTHEQLLPVFLDMDLADHMPKELIEIANKVRKENEDLPENIIRRKVRDACDHMRRRYGSMTKSAVESAQRTAIR